MRRIVEPGEVGFRTLQFTHDHEFSAGSHDIECTPAPYLVPPWIFNVQGTTIRGLSVTLPGLTYFVLILV